MDNDEIKSKILGLKSKRVGLIHCLWFIFKDMHFVANDLLKLNNAIKTCFISLNIILYYVF